MRTATLTLMDRAWAGWICKLAIYEVETPPAVKLRAAFSRSRHTRFELIHLSILKGLLAESEHRKLRRLNVPLRCCRTVWLGRSIWRVSELATISCPAQMSAGEA